MQQDQTIAPQLAALFEKLTGTRPPLRIRAWDRSEAGPNDTPTLVVHDPAALRRLLHAPGQLGLARAYIAGEIDLDGDLHEGLERGFGLLTARGGISLRAVPGALRQLAGLGALGPVPKPPPEEIRLRGERHSISRDSAAISHHYDVGNDFYRLLLGSSMVYSCAYWTRQAPDYQVTDAQGDKLDLVCRKLGLGPGMRLLDVGCGWGALVCHAAAHYGVSAVGVTVSSEQAIYAHHRAVRDGVERRVEIRMRDYRQVADGPYDAIASVGMAEHVGLERYPHYAAALHRLLKPGGRVLNHQIAALHRPVTSRARALGRWRPRRSFIDAYIFPDGQLAPLATTVGLLEDAGLEVRDVEALREHYARTLRAWVGNLERDWDTAVRLTSPARARIWQLYLAASAIAFETGRLGVNQILAVRPFANAASGMPPTRGQWMAQAQRAVTTQLSGGGPGQGPRPGADITDRGV
jgi:cyclopropane-fatty-acyl-phospholipid synthase